MKSFFRHLVLLCALVAMASVWVACDTMEGEDADTNQISEYQQGLEDVCDIDGELCDEDSGSGAGNGGQCCTCSYNGTACTRCYDPGQGSPSCFVETLPSGTGYCVCM